MAFTTRSPDGRSERRIVLDLIRDRNMQPGDLLTYEDLCEALNRGPEERHAVSQAARDASDRLLVEDGRVLVAEARRGYRMAKASEHLQIADSRRRRAGRQLKRGGDVVEHVRLDELTEQERVTTTKMVVALRQMAAVVDHVRRRQEAQDAAIEEVRRRLRVVERRTGVRRPETIDVETLESVPEPAP
ncbi:MAG: hypothetical protein IRZ28_22420 [Steroidobacteraceae bacterium]|nr:hypothetical protein [Steroidobacteraceae bacterium]